MPKRNSNDDDAVYCVSSTTYFSSEIEADNHYLRLKDGAFENDRSVEQYTWNEKNQTWVEMDSYSDPKREEPK